jgi:starch-binding outer membrane protein, SusD/RagB family
MKSSNLNIFFFAFTACLLLAACKKQLNVLPTTSEVDGDVITDVQSARTTLNGVYYRFADAGVDNNLVPITQWYQVQEGMPSELAGLVTYPYGGVDLADHSFHAASLSVTYIWNYGYDLVNAANGFLKNIEPVTSIDAPVKQQMMAEAKFLRAFGNATLLLYYGQYYDASSQYGIILRNEFVTAGSISLPRSSVADTYTSIITDLDSAIAFLPAQNSQKYYANIWAAKLLKARVLINRGTAEDYSAVIDLTKDIIANSPFSLEENVKDIFLSKGFSSNEVMMGIQPYTKGGSAKYSEYLYYTDYVGSDSLKSLLNNDPRSAWMYKTIPNPYYGGDEYIITKYYPGSVDDPTPDPITDYSYAFRLTEAYLLEAEALTSSGGDMDEAKALLKEVMKHAGITDFGAVDAASTKDALQLLIVKEEMKNFVAEGGQDWLAVRRLPFTTLQQLIPVIKDKNQFILPIPESEITANGQLAGKQNPGY